VTFAREGATCFVSTATRLPRGNCRDHHFRRRGDGVRCGRRKLRRCRGQGRLPKAYGRIDVLDNNVGIAEMGNVVDVSRRADHVFNVNQKQRSCHEARHPGYGPAGWRLDHQYLVDRLDPPSRHSYVTHATTKAAMNR
jgi:NAD(P)-dependent dehydrogenase (short-subunit alcohol dehydrogenase family)